MNSNRSLSSLAIFGLVVGVAMVIGFAWTAFRVISTLFAMKRVEAFAGRIGEKDEKSANLFVTRHAAAICRSWDFESYLRNADDLQRKVTAKDKERALFNRFRTEFGGLTQIGRFEADDVYTSGTDSWVRTSADCQFAKGRFNLRFSVRKAGSSWKIVGMQVFAAGSTLKPIERIGLSDEPKEFEAQRAGSKLGNWSHKTVSHS